MALKAGLVGVNPNGVDKNGMPKTGDVYTKSESDAKYATKTQVNACVPKTQLTANSKDFVFAYDSTSEKYGYKAGADGNFVPFSSGGGGAGWVKPSDLITTGLTFGSYVDYEEGGYYVDNDVVYFDMVIKKKAASTGVDIPSALQTQTTYYLNYVESATKADVIDNYVMTAKKMCMVGSRLALGSDAGTEGYYMHIFGQYTV